MSTLHDINGLPDGKRKEELINLISEAKALARDHLDKALVIEKDGHNLDYKSLSIKKENALAISKKIEKTLKKLLSFGIHITREELRRECSV